MTSGLWPAIRAQLNGKDRVAAGALFLVDGTTYPNAPWDPPPGAGFSSDIAFRLIDSPFDGLWDHYFIGYPAAITPMWPSVQLGRSYLVHALQMYADHWKATHGGSYTGMVLILSGYSQGAMVTGQVWTEDILAPDGVLNYLKDYVWRIYHYGDPFRCPGIAHGNPLAGYPAPPKKLSGLVKVNTGGIGGALDLTPEQTNVLAPDGEPVVKSFALDGDLYACCPVGDDPWHKIAEAGVVGNSIYKIIMQATFLNLISVAKFLSVPIGAVEEAVYGLTFAAQGMNAPHWQYWAGLDAAVNELIAIGTALPHSL